MTGGRVRGLTPTDRVMLGYLAFNTVILVWRSPAVGAWPLLLAANALSLALVALLARAPRSRLIEFVGGAYGILLTLAFYTQIGIITTDVGMVHDHLVQRWEETLFGGQASVVWHGRMPQAPLSWVLHACYGSYYWLVALAPLFLFARRAVEDFERGCFRITLAFYVCYAIFLVLPVAGPRYFFGVAGGPESEVLPARLVRWALEGGSAWGTAFPSSHVAASWCAVGSLWRPAPRLALAVWPIAVGLALGTVYGQFHYGVDALAGAALAVAILAIAGPLSRVLEPRTRRS